MKSENRNWDKVACNYVDDNGFCSIDVWNIEKKQREIIAWVDTLTGRVIYGNPLAQKDETAQKVIREVVKKAKEKHPYSLERLEGILTDIVAFECEELDTGVDVEQNLYSMGFSKDEMVFFGFPLKDMESMEPDSTDTSLSGKAATIKAYYIRSKDGKNLNPRETAGKYMALFGDRAAREYVDADRKESADFEDEVITYLNEYEEDSDKRIVRCKYCGKLYLWEESVWSCEYCADTFCNECVPICSEDEHVLCKSCKALREG